MRRLAAKVRAFLLFPVESLLQALHQDADAKLVQQASKLDQQASKLDRLSVQLEQQAGRISGFEDLIDGSSLCRRPVTASRLMEIVHCAKTGQAEWSDCDLILACPLTIDVAKAAFGQEKCVCLSRPEELAAVMGDARHTNVGIISPWLLGRLLDAVDGPYRLLRGCRGHLLGLFESAAPQREISLRRKLHEVGFYQVGILRPELGEEFVSVGCMPDGSFRLFASAPGFPVALAPWKAIKAARLPSAISSDQRWQSRVLVPFVETSLGFVPHDGGLGLALFSSGTDRASGVEIHADFRWRHPQDSQAALVGCYHGPGDTTMISAVLHVEKESVASVSLNSHHDSWRSLGAASIPRRLVATVGLGVYQVALGLRILESSIQVTHMDEVLLERKVEDLFFSPLVGIRASGCGVGVSGIAVSPAARAS
jgi:hypothetical protein